MHMGKEIGIFFSRYKIGNMIGASGNPTTLYERLMRPILVDAMKTKLCKI